MEGLQLKLYVSGHSSRTEEILKCVHEICKNELKGRCTLDVVDITADPEQARKNKIIMTPTLIKALPPPVKKVAGDLTQKEKILEGLDLQQI